MSSNAPIDDERGGDPRFEFGPFRLDPVQKILWRDQQVLPLGPKVVQTLAALVARPGEVVSREELVRQVWGDAVVEENSLAHNISVLRKTLKDISELVSIETVPRRGYRFSRKQSPAPEVQPTSTAKSASLPAATRIVPVKRWMGPVLAFCSLLFLGSLVAHLVGYRVLGKERRRSVAVIGFTNLSRRPESAWLSPALEEMLSAELTGSKLLIIPGESVARAKAELKLDDRDGFSFATLQRVRKNLGADLIVTGAYTVLPHANGGEPQEGQVRLDIRIQEASTGEVLDALTETGDEAGLFELVDDAGQRLRQDLGDTKLSPAQAEEARSVVPSNPEALRLYAQGIDKLRSFDALGAREFLQKSIQADPQYALAHSALADAFRILGDSSKSAEEARTAYELSSHLSREDRLIVEGRYRMSERDWKKAISIYENLSDLFPDNVEYGIDLAYAQISASDGHAALTTVKSLRRLPQPAGGDPRLDLKEYEAWKVLGDFNHMEAALAAAADNAKRQGALLLMARARSRQCWVERARGKPELASGDCEEARQIYAIAGDRAGEADCLRFLGDIVSSSDVKAAIRFYTQALSIEKEIGNLGGQAVMATMLGTENSSQGDHLTAINLYQQALAIFQQLEDQLDVAGLTIDVGGEQLALGRLNLSKKAYDDALAASAKIGNKYVEAMARYNIGELEQLQGDLNGAQQSYHEALEQLQTIGNKEYDVGITTSLGKVAMTKGDLAGARALYEQALSMQAAREQNISATEIELALDELSLEEGKAAAEIEPSLRRVIEAFRAGNDISGNNAVNNQAASVAALARCLSYEGKSAAALQTIQEAERIGLKAAPSFRLSTAVIAAPIRFAALPRSDRYQVLTSLQRTISEAEKSGYTGIELEARLTLGELEVKSGDRAGGRARLRAVEQDASRRGLGLIARKAHAA